MKSSVNIGYVVFLSVVAALGGFLFGYDTAVISGTIAKVTAQFNLDTMSQGWYVGCALIGSIVGVLFAGILSDKLGRKRTMILSAILFSMSAIGCAVCADFNQLAASSTRRSLSPFCGTTSFTFCPFFWDNHWLMISSSSMGYWSHTSLGIKGVPA